MLYSFSGEVQVPLNSIDLAGPVDEWKDLAPLDDGSDQYLVRNYLLKNIIFSTFSCRFLNPNHFFSNLNYNCSNVSDLRNLQGPAGTS